MLHQTLIVLLAATCSIAAPLVKAAGPSVYLNALGMGVANKAATSTFYTKVFGIKKTLSMPVANMGQGGWKEDIDTFPTNAHSSALVPMEWTDKRSVKDLPIKLTFAVDNPKEKQALVAKSGGKESDLTSATNPEAVYATDPDGYLLELVKGEGIPRLLSVGVGVSNLKSSVAWWAGATGITPGPIAKSKQWDTIAFKFEKGSQLVFMDWHESPKRSTQSMPMKLVLAAGSTKDLTKAIQAQSPKGKQAGAMAMFQFEPLE